LGISDLLDGFLARRWEVSSRFGARLDSAADFLLCGIMLYILFYSLCWPLWILIWVGVIFLVRFTSLAINYVRFSQISFLHSYANKVTGILLFLFPLFMRIFGQDWTMIILSTVASLSAMDELLISIYSSKFDPNRKSIFHK
jgi:CDP-diacylglycerol--glycerol-3-phosphate 3-phosphatidyltransferase